MNIYKDSIYHSINDTDKDINTFNGLIMLIDTPFTKLFSDYIPSYMIYTMCVVSLLTSPLKIEEQKRRVKKTDKTNGQEKLYPIK